MLSPPPRYLGRFQRNKFKTPMAGVPSAGAATISVHRSPATTTATTPRKPLVIVYSLSSPFPRRTRRMNHLRQKILKTLENTTQPPSTTLIIPTDETTREDFAEIDQHSVSETTGFVGGIARKFSTRSVIKVGLYLIGAFVFQQICAVFIFGLNDLKRNMDSDSYNKARVLDLGVNENNSSEMDKRIVEIQAMAREARHVEAKKKRMVEEESDDFIEIEKEVDDRLIKLGKRIENSYAKLPYNFLRKEDEARASNEIEQGNVDAKGAIFDPLMFKKKYKYTSPSLNDLRDKPKGFGGVEDNYVVNGTLKNAINGTLQNEKEDANGVYLFDKGEEIDRPNEGASSENNSVVMEDELPLVEPINRLVNESERANSRSAKAQSTAGFSKKKSSNLEARKPRGFGKQSQGDTSISTKHDNVKRGKNGGNKKSTESSLQTDFWWSNLPYVLAIVMQRGGDGNGERSEGLFTVRSTSQSNNKLSHTVAFEDVGDATNFSYLLTSFFEDLGDFRADIIPIPINELGEAVKSEAMKVIVVKKGELQLYIGKPLADVEIELRSLIEQNGI